MSMVFGGGWDEDWPAPRLPGADLSEDAKELLTLIRKEHKARGLNPKEPYQQGYVAALTWMIDKLLEIDGRKNRCK